MKFSDEIKNMHVIIAKRTNDLISNKELVIIGDKYKDLVVDTSMVADVHEAIGICIVKASNDMDFVRVPSLGVFQVYEGRRNTLDYIATQTKLGLTKEEIKEQMKVDINTAYKQGILSKNRKGFKLL